MTKCACCPRRCGVNRLEEQVGFCRIGAHARVAHVGLHFGEEPPISGQRGSGTIFFAGCNLRCLFCQNYQISQEFQAGDTETMTTDELAAAMLRLQDSGAHNINFVSPSHVLWQMADAIIAAKEKGLHVPVVYNSNGYDSVAALRQIRGLVDIYMPDIKYMHNGLAGRLSAADDYADIVPGVLSEMLEQVGQLDRDEEGIAVRGLLVRHLVLPGQLDNSRHCLQLLAALSRDTFVSIMSQYSPQYKACADPGLNRTLTQAEYDEITDYALALGLENAYIQELQSQDLYVPDFARQRPFDSTLSQ
ncbi:radical SAM protein [candidate division KSB1 bacterium]|nr:MAG: radical SAM protein [candidate division KSB1 bacterium]